MDSFMTPILNAALKMAKDSAKNYASQLTLGTVTSADPDGRNARVRLAEGFDIYGELLEQTMFTIENVIRIPESDNPEHSHVVNPDMGKVKATAAGIEVEFIPTSGDPMSTWYRDQNADPTTLVLQHSHGGKTRTALPEIRLWRGVQAGDEVLVLKVNPRSYVLLCPLIGGVNNKVEGGENVTTYT